MSEILQVTCPNCSVLNRVPETRLREKPNCGKCREALFTGQVLELSAPIFYKHSKSSDIPLLVDFWAPWCEPCKMMAPQLATAAHQLEPQMRLGKVNTDVEQALGAQYAIRSIPTLILFHKGREISRHAGAMMASDIVQWARQLL